jgi:uncharacterized protein
MRKLNVIAPIEITVEASVNPSESSEKVIAAIRNVVDRCFPEFKHTSRVIAKCFGSESLGTIYEQIRSRSAMGVLRRLLTNNRIKETTWFLLNKQAATAGIVAAIEDEKESPLGPIRITIVCEELDLLVDWLVPV